MTQLEFDFEIRDVINEYNLEVNLNGYVAPVSLSEMESLENELKEKKNDNVAKLYIASN